MTLHEMASALMLLLREGSVSDDEKLDIRLLKDLIKSKRSEYIAKTSKPGYGISNNATQDYFVNFELSPKGELISTTEIPDIIHGVGGPLIREITSNDRLDIYPFTYVPIGRFRFSGNGKYNQNMLYATIMDSHLYLKSKNDAYKLITSCYIDAAFEDPLDIPGFSDELDDYPIDNQGFEYIKDAMFQKDLSYFVAGESDLTNDADGEIPGV